MDSTRSQILTASSELFLKYGLRSVTIDDICTEIRISKKTFYNYFRQKEELIENVLIQYCENNKTQSEKKHTFWEDPGLNCIDKIVVGSRHWNDDHQKEYMVFFYDLIKYYPDIHKKMLMKVDEDAVGQIKQWLLQGIDEGLIRTDVETDLLANYINIQFRKNMPDLIATGNVNLVKMLDFLLDACVRVLVNEKGYQYYQEKYKHNYPKINTAANQAEDNNEGSAKFYWSSAPPTRRRAKRNVK
jgi:AcrR family transcriptional regulator